MRSQTKKGKIRYAVVGLGHIAQTAVLPAFKNASSNSEMVALISSDPKKLRTLGKRYKVEAVGNYADFEDILANAGVDAVYIATPNTCHSQFAAVAASYGVHVLCEKPLATTTEECLMLEDLATKHRIKAMTAYRLHFDPANIEAIKVARSGEIGDLRIFNSIFTMQVRDPENIRLQQRLGGGPLFDIGIYCINAARYLFGDEPLAVSAHSFATKDPRFRDVDEMVSVTMNFPRARVASFVCSFGAADNSVFDLIGTSGSLRLENAYEYAEPMTLTVTKGDRHRKRHYKKHDQFAAELLYFSDCIQKNKRIEPSFEEGLIDVEIIEALQHSLQTGEITPVKAPHKVMRPSRDQKIVRPGIKPPPTIHAHAPSK